MTEYIIDSDQLLSLSNKVINKINEKHDLDAIEVFFTLEKSLQVTFAGQSISSERDTIELGFSVRVIKDEVEGFSYTNKYDLDSLLLSANESIKMANISVKKPGISLPSQQSYPTVDGLYSNEVRDLTVDDLIDYANTFLLQLRHPSVKINTDLSRLYVSESWTGIVNSNGVEGFQKGNALHGNFFCVPREGAKVGSFISEIMFTRDTRSLDLVQTGQDIRKKAIRNLDVKTLSSIDSDIVIFSPESITTPIGVVIAMAVAADQVQQNRSIWKDRLADQVAVEDFNFIDEPHNPEAGMAAKVFDDEGTKTQDTHIIKNGVLEHFLFDEFRASKAGTKSTGNSWRSLNTSRFTKPPSSIFPNGPIIKAGDSSFDELIEDVKQGIIIERFAGSQRTENGIFSGLAKGTQLIENGEISSPLTNVTIAGNVFDVLNNITGLGKKIKLADGIFRGPHIKTKGINITTQKS